MSLGDSRIGRIARSWSLYRAKQLTRAKRKRGLTKSLRMEVLEQRTMLTTAPLGDQFVVSEAFGFTETPAALVVHADGSFTTAWESFEEDGSGFGVFAQRFNADGNSAGLRIPVNTTIAREQSAPAIASDALGNTLIVWQSKGQDGDGFGIYGQWLDFSGQKKGQEFRINSFTANDQKAPAVAIDGMGRAIVAWQSYGQDGSDWGIYSTILEPVAGEVYDTVPNGDRQVNDASVGMQKNPSIAAATNGTYVIVWEAIDPIAGDDASLDIYSKLFDSAGQEVTYGEKLVNSEQIRDQITPSVAMDSDGDYVVVWTAGGIPASGSDVFGQRFDRFGQRLEQQFRINNTTLAAQVGGAVTMDSHGNFLVVWQSVHQDGFSEGVYSREYDIVGNTIVGATSDFLINTTIEGPQSLPSIAMNGTGRAVVAWHGSNSDHQSALFAQLCQVPNTEAFLKVGGELELALIHGFEDAGVSAAMDLSGNSVVVFESYDQDGDAMGVFGQRVDAWGDGVGSPFQVNTTYLGTQGAPAVASRPDSNGDFVVAWQSNQEGDYDIFGQRFTSDGIRIGGEFRINTTIVGTQVSPSIAMRDDGGFIVVWQGDTGDGTSDIFGQRFNGDGSATGPEFLVNQFRGTDQIMPVVSMNAHGEFAIAWVSSHPMLTVPELDPEKSVFVQWYNSDGMSFGPEVIAHTFVKDAQESPQIGLDSRGDFVVAWQSINQDGSTWGVFGRQFDSEKNPKSPMEFQVNESTQGLQRLVGLGVNSEGGFVIAFENTLPGTEEGISTDIYRREYLSDGSSDGHENLVNTWSGGPQIKPTIARSMNGDYGVFWLGQGFSHIDGVHGRLYDSDLIDDPGQPSRLPIGDQFLVGTALGFDFSAPAVAVHADGSYTLAFETFEEDSSGFGIFMQRFHSDGSPVANSRAQVNTTPRDDQSAPAIASDPEGNVLIVWQSKDKDGYGIFGQWFGFAGGKLGGEFQLNAFVSGDQTKPDVAIDETGMAIVTWQSKGQDRNGLAICYTILSPVSEGIPDTKPSGDIRANMLVAGDQQEPRVAVTPWDNDRRNNQFIIAWQGPGIAEEGDEAEASIAIFARRLNGEGAVEGDEFVVNSNPLHDKILPDIGLDQVGNAFFVWQVEGQEGSGSDIFGRGLRNDGTWMVSDTRINTTKSRPQRLPSLSVSMDGRFLVTWQSQHQDGYSWGIYRQGFDASWTPVGGEVIVNHRVEGPQTAPTVSSNGNGDAIIAWLGNSATHQPSVFGHRFQIPSTEIAGEILLASYQGLEESPPAAAMDGDRNSVVVWQSYAEDGSGMGVYAQLMNKEGIPGGNRFLVNENITFGNQTAPAIARSRSGEFVIAWQSESTDGYDVFARCYTATGTPAGEIFRVNPSTLSGDQKSPTVAMDHSGRFVIAWQSDAGDGSTDIMAQAFNPTGNPMGGAFRVNQETVLDQYDPSISMNGEGMFVLAWVSNHPAALPETLDTEKSIFVQTFGSDWQPVGEREVLVHRYVKDAQEAPSVGIDQEGRFVVSWQSINQDGNSWGVFARRFQFDMTPIDRREFVINETRLGPQRFAGIGVDDYGRFLIAWQSNSRAELTDGGSGGGAGGGEPGSPEGSSWDLFVRQYSWDGTPEGGELSVNSWKLGPQILPVVTQTPGGDAGIFWLGQGPGHVEGVHGRLYQSLFDFGDAPDPTYTTLLASDGARHLPFSTLYLGSGMDGEFDAYPTLDANGDDLDNAPDDEDGVQFPSELFAGTFWQIVVTASEFGFLKAWIDWNEDGVFAPAELVIENKVIGGANTIGLRVSEKASPGTKYARFRLSSESDLGPAGVARDGEVEDYRIEVMPRKPIRLDNEASTHRKSPPMMTSVSKVDFGMYGLGTTSLNAAMPTLDLGEASSIQARSRHLADGRTGPTNQPRSESLAAGLRIAPNYLSKKIGVPQNADVAATKPSASKIRFMDRVLSGYSDEYTLDDSFDALCSRGITREH